MQYDRMFMSNVELTNIKSINITSSPTYSNTHFACFKSKNEKMVTFDKKNVFGRSVTLSTIKKNMFDT